MLNKSRFFLVSAASMLLLNACTAKDDSKLAAAPTDSGVAATVNGMAIQARRVDFFVKQRTAQGQPDTPELRRAIIDNLAMQMLAAEEGTKKGLDKAPETQDQMALNKQSILANAFVQDYLKTHVISDDMLKAEYDKVKAEQTGTEYKARHILVAKQEQALAIIAKLKKDVKAFGALAKDKSMDPGSKGNGGDLGWFSPKAMVPEFGAAVAKLEKGKFTDTPVKTQFGFHVIMLEDARPVQAPPFEEVKEQLAQKVRQQSLKQYFDDLKAKAKIEIVGAPVAPAASVAPAAPATGAK